MSWLRGGPVISMWSRHRVLSFVVLAAAVVVFLAAMLVAAKMLRAEYKQARTIAIEVQDKMSSIEQRVAFMHERELDVLVQIPTDANDLEMAVGNRYELMVAGHIYRLNGFTGVADPAYVNLLSTAVSRLQPDYFVFAGDTVKKATRTDLGYIEDQLLPKFAVETGLAIGNHDLLNSDYFEDELFRKLFTAPDWHVDIGGLRLVVLNTARPGENGLNAASIRYAREVLDGTYQSAVVVMHHGVWLTQNLGAFANNSPEHMGFDPLVWSNELLPLLGPADIVIGGDGGDKSSTMFTTICGVRHYLTGWSGTPKNLDVLAIDLGENGLDVHLMTLDRSMNHVTVAIPAQYLDVQPDCS